MITVYIDRSKNYQDFLVTGHANAAEYGKDIVCAAISTISCMLANMAASVKREVTVQQREGFSHICINGQETTRLRAILDTIQTGYEAVAAEYPEYVQVIYQEEGS